MINHEKYGNSINGITQNIETEDLNALTTLAEKGNEELEEAIKTAYKLGIRKCNNCTSGNVTAILVDLEKGLHAITSILDDYEWDFEPNPVEAIRYIHDAYEERDKNYVGKHTYEYLCGYSEIIWLANVALDYTRKAISGCQKVIDITE